MKDHHRRLDPRGITKSVLLSLGVLASACAGSIQIYYREPFQFAEYQEVHGGPILIVSQNGPGPMSYFQIYCIVNTSGGDFTFDPTKVVMIDSAMNDSTPNGDRCNLPNPPGRPPPWNNQCPTGGTPLQPLDTTVLDCPTGVCQWSTHFLNATPYFVQRNSNASLVQSPFTLASFPASNIPDNQGVYHHLRYLATPGQTVAMMPQGGMPPPFWGGFGFVVTGTDFAAGKVQADNRTFPTMTCP